MPTCIYCRRVALEPFPAEHVIPRSLGLFRNGLTLHCVCGDCNQFFGDQLELHFGRETGESIVRFQYGLRDSVAGTPRSRLTARIKVPGPAFGADRMWENAGTENVGTDGRMWGRRMWGQTGRSPMLELGSDGAAPLLRTGRWHFRAATFAGSERAQD